MTHFEDLCFCSRVNLELFSIGITLGGQPVIVLDCIFFLLPFLAIIKMSTVSFLAQLDSGIFCP